MKASEARQRFDKWAGFVSEAEKHKYVEAMLALAVICFMEGEEWLPIFWAATKLLPTHDGFPSRMHFATERFRIIGNEMYGKDFESEETLRKIFSKESPYR